MKRIEVQLTDENIHGLFAVSLVDAPAIESGWVALRDQRDTTAPILMAGEASKQTITGAILIPNKPIYRVSPTGEEFEIVFTGAVIEQLRDKFMFEKRTDHVTEMHEIGVNGVYMVEMWMVADSENDKAAALGLSVPPGTLMCTMKVNNPDVWEKMKSGDYTGFSIEAYLDMEKLALSQQDDPELKILLEVLGLVDGLLS